MEEFSLIGVYVKYLLTGGLFDKITAVIKHSTHFTIKVIKVTSLHFIKVIIDF